MNINFNSILKPIMPYFTIFIVVYFSMTILGLYLPKSGIEHNEQENYGVKYTKYNYIKAFDLKPKKVAPVKVKPKEVKKYALLTSIELQAIYASNKKGNGWIVFLETSTKNSHILSVNEEFKGYLLKSVYANFVIFLKGKKQYKVYLDKDEKAKKEYIREDKKIPKKTTIKEQDLFEVKKKDIKYYANNFKEIWNNISISEIKKDDNIEGFRIDGIKKNSIFGKLGIKKGDIIISVNNIKLNSYESAFKLYKDINNIGSLHIVVLRDKKEVEIDYDINN